jgi:TadE-like protein
MVAEAQRDRRRSGQALVEFTLVFPIFLTLVVGIISLGLGVFYQQQVENVARQAARYAAIHSSQAQCPSTSNDPFRQSPPFSFYACDTPAASWPEMTKFGRQSVWGMDPSLVKVSACWSSYHIPGDASQYDQPPADAATGVPNELGRCKYARVEADPSSLSCPAPATSGADDEGTDTPGNEVSVYACFVWRPPMAGFLLIPTQITMRAVVTEIVHKQQAG